MARVAKKASTPATGRSTKAGAKKKPRSTKKSLAPAATRRGLSASEIRLAPESRDVAELVHAIEQASGAVIGCYREPLSGRALVVASLPIEAVEPTPFQRDLSPTHAKRLAEKIEESGSFLDPIIVVRGASGGFWTPNGRHRLAAAKVLGLRQITGLISPDESLAYRILALNTEKAHNLRDRSLEVIRMARAIAKDDPKAKESAWAIPFEAPELLTIGILYEQNGRFPGSAYAPVIRKLDRFTDAPLVRTLRDREGLAARIVEIESIVKTIIAGLQERGFRSPYLRTFVVARINPVRFVPGQKKGAKPTMAMPAALTRMLAAAKKFDLGAVRSSDLALVAAVAPAEEEA